MADALLARLVFGAALGKDGALDPLSYAAGPRISAASAAAGGGGGGGAAPTAAAGERKGKRRRKAARGRPLLGPVRVHRTTRRAWACGGGGDGGGGGGGGSFDTFGEEHLYYDTNSDDDDEDGGGGGGDDGDSLLFDDGNDSDGRDEEGLRMAEQFSDRVGPPLLHGRRAPLRALPRHRIADAGSFMAAAAAAPRLRRGCRRWPR